MNNKKRFVCLLVAVFVILIAAVIIFPTALAYSGYKAYQANEQFNNEKLTDPEEVVRSFYNDYLSYEGNPLVDKTYQDNNMLSDSFIAFLDDFTANEMMYDPVICAQDRPENIIADKALITADQASVSVTSSFEGHRFDVKLRQDQGTWKIDMVVCDAN